MVGDDRTSISTQVQALKRAAIYCRVSPPDQHVESQLYDLRQFAAQRGYEVVSEYADRGISGTKARRPGLDALMADARRGQFKAVLVAAFDRIARSTKHFLQVVDELDGLGIEFISKRENIDTSGPMGRFFIVLIGALSEAERCMLADRVRAGVFRARLEGKRIGRAPLQVNRAALIADRERGVSLKNLAQAHGISKASVCRVLAEAQQQGVSVGCHQPSCAAAENKAVAACSAVA